MAYGATEESSRSIQMLMYYDFEGNTLDQSGRNHGLCHGATLTGGVLGQGYEFDGIDDYIAIENLNFHEVGKKWTDNWSFVDFDRSEYFNFYIRGNDGRLGFSTSNTNRNNKFFEGTLDEVRIYQRVLTPDEILELYQEVP